ncbi:MAG: hypothetical protein IIZ23_03670 [Ruminococcus sp.]|nr:hypothetical protein [Ruminococcus sp.]
MKRCPKCGRKSLMRYLPFNREANNGAKYRCRNCNSNFGTPPVCRETGEDYRDIAVYLEFRVSVFRGGRNRILIKKDTAGIELSAWSRLSPDPDIRRQMENAEWKKLLDRLYGKLYLHEWKKSFVEPKVMDGAQWELKLAFTGDRVESYYGSNRYPPYWEKLEELFDPYWQEARSAASKKAIIPPPPTIIPPPPKKRKPNK